MPELELRNKLTVIEKREQQYRQEVAEAITLVEADVTGLLNNAACPESMHLTLEEALLDLKRGLAHLDAGLSIRELPISVELIEFPAPSAQPEPEPEPEQEPLSAVELNAPVAQETPPITGADDGTAEAPRQPINRWKKIWRWLTTPRHVKWRDIDDK